MNKKLPKLENPKKIANGKAKVTYPKSRKKMRDLPKLDDVQKKKGETFGCIYCSNEKENVCSYFFRSSFWFSFFLLYFKFD